MLLQSYEGPKMGGAGLFLMLIFICVSASAQQKVRISLLYQEPQSNKVRSADDADSIKIYVIEPFQQVRSYATPDFDYETNIDFAISEYCPVQVCKNIALTSPSIQIIKTRLTDFKNQKDQTRSIYEIFEF